MFGREKKTYDAPAIHKFALDDSDMEKVTGGIKPQTTYKEEHDNVINEMNSNNESGSGEKGSAAADPGTSDVGRGRGRGGGCDGVAYHRNARTFSSGRNSGC